MVSIPEICRVEGHIDLLINMENEKVKDVKAKCLEGNQILEKILIGRSFQEVPEISSRICGVCSIIHKLTSIQAIEDAFKVELNEEIEALRKLVAYTGHLYSHIFHIFAMIYPDYTGNSLDSIFVESIRKHDFAKIVETIKAIRSATDILCGRAVHPITPVVGGFSKIPSKSNLVKVRRLLGKVLKTRDLLDHLLEGVSLDFTRRTEYLALKGYGEIPILKGDICRLDGEIFDSRLFTDYIREIEVDYTTARHFMLRNGRTYMVGAISRLNVNHEMLCEEAMELLNGHEIEFPCYSPFGNIVAQVLEIIHFTVQSISLIDEILDMYPFKSSVEVTPREGIGLSVTEAPRGLLLHTYELDSNGRVQSVNIITPTAQNLENLEADVKAYIEYLIAKGDIENLKHRIEMLTRAYDPCMSCSARFAKAR